jgi:hypothetical protein
LDIFIAHAGGVIDGLVAGVVLLVLTWIYRFISPWAANWIAGRSIRSLEKRIGRMERRLAHIDQLINDPIFCSHRYRYLSERISTFRFWAVAAGGVSLLTGLLLFVFQMAHRLWPDDPVLIIGHPQRVVLATTVGLLLIYAYICGTLGELLSGRALEAADPARAKSTVARGITQLQLKLSKRKGLIG